MKLEVSTCLIAFIFSRGLLCPLWEQWEYVYFILLSSPKRKYALLTISNHILLCSYETQAQISIEPTHLFWQTSAMIDLFIENITVWAPVKLVFKQNGNAFVKYAQYSVQVSIQIRNMKLDRL